VSAEHTNRLALETSPYLLQHAKNPVDWYAWGDEALTRAAREDKPILLSIGYAACHWCHVMERESFENPAIAELMNQSFVCIKVDREERPDLDDIYMTATVALSGSGGWPMTVFLAPDQRPFFAGTYFPPQDKYGRPGFTAVLRGISELWQMDRERLLSRATLLTEHIREQSNIEAKLDVDVAAIHQARLELERSFDPEFGGFGEAPKFPPCSALSLLLREHRRSRAEGTLEIVRGTLDGMHKGGIYDHLAGGFARYSTDERWLVPHFEKMLYDNAQLGSVYIEAYQVTQDPEYARVARETLDYVMREMQSPDGGYFSSTDADSEGVEGKFFVWTREEVLEILGPDAGDHFAAYYDVTPEGNWEGNNILHTPRPLETVARELGLDQAALRVELARSRQALYVARLERVPPLLDDKVLTSWNGLMLSAMASGYRVLGERQYLESAERAATFLLRSLVRPDGGLFHTARQGRAHVSGFLEDYAFFADGLVSMYEAGAASGFLSQALSLAERMIRDFGDPASGAFFNTAHDHERLLARPREGHDNAIPSANAVAARVLARLGRHFDRQDLTERAEAAVRAYGKLVERSPRAFATALTVVDFLAEAQSELVLVGSPGQSNYEALRRAVAERFLPNHVQAHLDPKQTEHDGSEKWPLLAGKTLVLGQAALYVCKDYACLAPLTDPARVLHEFGARI
jgi:uncharacterized protein